MHLSAMELDTLSEAQHITNCLLGFFKSKAGYMCFPLRLYQHESMQDASNHTSNCARW